MRRLRGAGLSGRTIVLKVRRYDFSTLTRSETLRGPTDDPAVVREAAARLLEAVDTTGGVRLLGVGVSGLADYTQEDLFAQARRGSRRRSEAGGGAGSTRRPRSGPAPARSGAGRAGHDVRHAEYGHGWVQGSGLGRVTVRFETAGLGARGGCGRSGPTIPELEPADPLPLVALPGREGRRRSGRGADRCRCQSVPASRPKSWSGAAGGGPTSRP